MTRVIEWVRSVQGLLPEVAKPQGGKSSISLTDKLMWTAAALLVYLVCSQMPLYGIGQARNSDPFYIMRMILASSRGSLMELGVTPIITSGTIMQVLQGARIIDVDMSLKEDRQLFSATTKLLGLLITVGEAVAYVLSGMYGDVGELGMFLVLALIAQLVAGGVVVLMLDDLLDKGYGLASGLNLFIVTNICEGIVWRALSPTTYNIGKGTEFEGAVIATIYSFFARPNKLGALQDSLFRENLPNLTNLAATALVFFVVIFVQGFKVELPLMRTQGPAQAIPPYTVKLFYTSNMPIILLSTLVSNVYFVSQLLHRRYAGNILIRLLGRWDEDPSSGQSRPVAGLAYYISPPNSFTEVLADPFHALFYIVFMLTVCALFAKVWIEVTGTGPADVARQLQDGGVTLRSNPNDPLRRLQRIIPTAAAFGGMCVAALSILADLLGAAGSGTGILMAVSLIYDMYERLKKDMEAEVKKDPSSFWAQFVKKEIRYQM